MSFSQLVDTQLDLKLAQICVIQFNGLRCDRNGFIFHIESNIPKLIFKLPEFSHQISESRNLIYRPGNKLLGVAD